MPASEKPGQFYLGRPHDVATGQTAVEPLLYDSQHLTTHAVCVGMTGSGKTGLCLALLEEAALNGIPSIAIDPKGDLGNLLLTFPELRGSDFRPWIDESVASRKGVTPDEFAQQTADLWRSGLAKWNEDGERIGRFANSVDRAIYTPGSSAGLQLTILKSFAAPPKAVLDDGDAFRDRVQGAAAGVLALLGVDADPVNSREFILLARVLEEAWRTGRDLELHSIIAEIKTPRFTMVGAAPLDNFFPSRDRDAFAMRLNNLLASPTFAGWLQGEPLDVQSLLYTMDGKPRLSVLSIAHLDESERKFFVTLLLNEVITWMRAQPGTGSLRAILYMDEVYGYFPPTANPPTKRPMLTLLKQARAYGLGCVLATQNPVDLDYKGLSNAGTWILGRLQTERDKMRVIEGLEGASTEAGAGFDKAKMQATLAALDNRVFLMNNVHAGTPTVFQSRWALSYLAGPLTRAQIGALMADRKRSTASTPPVETSPKPVGGPLLPSGVAQRFRPVDDSRSAPLNAQLQLRPALLGYANVHYVQTAPKFETWQKYCILKSVDDSLTTSPWTDAQALSERPELVDAPPADARFLNLPGELAQQKTYGKLKSELKDWLYQTQRFTRFTCPEVNAPSQDVETESQFRARVAPLLPAARQARVTQEFINEQGRLEKAIEKATADRAENRWWFPSLLANAGARLAEIIITGLIGRRSRKQLVTTTLWNQAMKSRRLAAEAKQRLNESQAALAKLADRQRAEMELAAMAVLPADVPLDTLEIPPRKSDIDVDEVALVWLPWWIDASGAAQPAFQ